MGYSPRGHQESDMTERLHYTKHFTIRELNGASLAAQLVKNLPAMRETWVQPWVGKIPWRRKWQPTLVFLPGEYHGLRSLVGYSPRGRKESDTTERLQFTSLHFIGIYMYKLYT